MTKAEVEDEQLGKCVIMPQSCELSFMAWWKQFATTAIVNVQYPLHRHGNSGKPSHSAKKDANPIFLLSLTPILSLTDEVLIALQQFTFCRISELFKLPKRRIQLL